MLCKVRVFRPGDTRASLWRVDRRGWLPTVRPSMPIWNLPKFIHFNHKSWIIQIIQIIQLSGYPHDKLDIICCRFACPTVTWALTWPATPRCWFVTRPAPPAPLGRSCGRCQTWIPVILQRWQPNIFQNGLLKQVFFFWWILCNLPKLVPLFLCWLKTNQNCQRS